METDLWLGVEVRHLAALQAIARAGTFGAAASQLGYTQSAISQQIAVLERRVGERLVDRPNGTRQVALTDAGALLLRHAETILGQLRAARSDLTALTAGERGTVRVGTFQSVGARLLPAIVRRFSETRPEVEIELVEEQDTDELLRLLEAGELDFAFATPPFPDRPLGELRLLRDPFVLVVPAESGLAASREPLAAELLGELRLVTFRRCATVGRVEAALELLGIRPNIVLRADDAPTLLGLVAEGLGYAFVPRLAADPGASLTVVPLEDSVPARLISLVWHLERSCEGAGCGFVEAARAAAAELEQTLV